MGGLVKKKEDTNTKKEQCRSINPTPSYHLCPDFSIAPPPNGHLQLGSMLSGLDIDGVSSPLDFNATKIVPESELLPRDSPQVLKGFSRSLRDLRGLRGSMWARLCGNIGSFAGVTASFLKSRDHDEILTIDKVFIRYFIPSKEYMKQALGIDGMDFYIKDTRMRESIYMVTGLMWTEGARLSNVSPRASRPSARLAVASPSTGTTGTNGRVAVERVATSFDGLSPFLLGLRVRRIWWDKSRIRHDVLETVGATLGNPTPTEDIAIDGMCFADDESDIYDGNGLTAVQETLLGEPGSFTWVLP
ncbi:major facilitator superfamily mfs-1 [Colletotrichum kahawae]|uniref:Major facilitator superfamily mfs-1 n=1 Tax=Colletotrichum kahawae TaxID=34407 RepID=A0AAD9Y5R6_COLKA|nr:major facilitator superfamily mfs-1 [Colletotrichum kahawae]